MTQFSRFASKRKGTPRRLPSPLPPDQGLTRSQQSPGILVSARSNRKNLPPSYQATSKKPPNPVIVRTETTEQEATFRRVTVPYSAESLLHRSFHTHSDEEERDSPYPLRKRRRDLRYQNYIMLENEITATKQKTRFNDDYVPSEHTETEDTMSSTAASEQFTYQTTEDGISISAASKNAVGQPVHVHHFPSSEKTRKRKAREKRRLQELNMKSELLDDLIQPEQDFLCDTCKERLIGLLNTIRDRRG